MQQLGDFQHPVLWVILFDFFRDNYIANMAANNHLKNTTIYVSNNSLKSFFFKRINFFIIPDKIIFVHESDRGGST